MNTPELPSRRTLLAGALGLAFTAALPATANAAPSPAFKKRYPLKAGTRLSSHFGYRFHPIEKRVKLHKGADWAAPRGRKVRAAADAVVVGAFYNPWAGRHIVLAHPDGTRTVYKHLSKGYVRTPGRKIKRGHVIGRVGSTGASTGPHLHFEVLKGGTPIDPLAWLTNGAKRSKKPTDPRVLAYLKAKGIKP